MFQTMQKSNGSKIEGAGGLSPPLGMAQSQMVL